MKTIAVCLLVLLAAGLGQPAADGQTPGPGPAAEAADSELEALVGAFRNLFQSLQAKGGVAAEDHEVLRGLRERVASFNSGHPGDSRGLAMELQLSEWLGDRERVDELFPRLAVAAGDVKIGLAWARYHEGIEDPQGLDAIYERLAELFPGEPEVAIGRAKSFTGVNDYGRALEILQEANIDAAAQPEGAILLSDCLFAEQRYQDAVDALEAIPQETRDAQTTVRFKLGSLLPKCQEYVVLWDQEQQIRSAEAAAGDLPRAEVITARGRIVVELFENEAPNTVANFISLAESGFYDGTTFHRVLPNFMAQGGDPNTRAGATGAPGSGTPGYRIMDEHDLESARKHFTGSLAMAKKPQPHTAGCQFYFTHTAPAHLNGMHTVFGRIVEGLDVARRLEVGDALESVTVLSKRDHAYEPQTLPEITEEAPDDDLETSLGLPPRTLSGTPRPTEPPETPESGEPQE
ncbi:MAG: peptidylprolyl isomerase [Planctomycetota bacterium]|jgi:cyclophilin family peptidyl-prolyl cis-trans isomerase